MTQDGQQFISVSAGPDGSIWGINLAGALLVGRRAPLRISALENRWPKFRSLQPRPIVWTDWQVDNTAPQNMTCITATGTGQQKGYIFGLLDGDLYSTLQSDPRQGVAWAAWSKLAIPGPAVSSV